MVFEKKNCNTTFGCQKKLHYVTTVKNFMNTNEAGARREPGAHPRTFLSCKKKLHEKQNKHNFEFECCLVHFSCDSLLQLKITLTISES